ncbi:hypothetical protein MWU54_12815 [Marivita sp. S6314]|uniref:DUF6778 family protein n=1 Tax=Marivita sp. S6314 TaxID=2926406 RepID=UPI001FF59EF8|nr:DUF6778 family protein [Marivita sp. S6314]MCK0150914.1 hypothetical protein [Marivita sp. S6314]
MKTLFKSAVAVALALSLSACASTQSASRAAMPDDTMMGLIQPDYTIDSFTVSVPKSLTVNERNTYYPRGDIVWRGDALGDRHAQVKAMFETSLRAAAPRVQGSRPVRVDIQVTRFHALSEKARYTVGGVHDISFLLRLVDAETGLQIGRTKDVSADLAGLDGQAAIAADARGDTQKNRLTTHLTNVLIEELTVPGGHRNADLGLLQRINNL